MANSPFLIFPWDRSFLEELKQVFEEDYRRGALPLLVCPSFGPWQYLRELYKKDGCARILPRFMTLKKMTNLWYAGLPNSMPREASLLEALLFLQKAVNEASDFSDVGLEDVEQKKSSFPWGLATDDPRRDKIPSKSLSKFYPWAINLYNVFEETFKNGIESLYLGSEKENKELFETSKYAQKLVGSLNSIRETYIAELELHAVCTSGYKSFTITKQLEDDGKIPASFYPSEKMPVYIAGFHTLTRTEEKIIKALWEAGAHICLHTDPEICREKDGGHWICQRHRDWMKSWNAASVIMQDGQPLSFASYAARSDEKNEPEFSFVSSYDLHSQLRELSKDLLRGLAAPREGKITELTEEGRAALSKSILLLPHSSLLVPVLHHLPEEVRNGAHITLGISLKETALARLLRSLIVLNAKSRINSFDDYECHWKSFVICMENPFLASLMIDEQTSFRAVLNQICTVARSSGRRYFTVEDILLNEKLLVTKEEKSALEELFSYLITNFADLTSMSTLATALEKLCSFIRSHTRYAQEASLDYELLLRIEQTLIPSLGRGEAALTADRIISLIEDTLYREPIFFTPKRDKTAGLQVLGIIDSALLHFDNVYILDATDDRIPGKQKHDPLLPDAVRETLGLPNLNLGDQEVAYAVHRLCANAKRVRFYWQEGIARAAISEGKKERSRFIDEFLWEIEKKRGKLVKKNEDPCYVVQSGPKPHKAKARCIKIEGHAKERMKEFLAGPITPTVLDKYMRCPLQFGFMTLGRLSPVTEVNEEDDHVAVGEFLHKVLEEFYTPYVAGSPLPSYPGSEERTRIGEELVALFKEKLYDPLNMLQEDLPPTSLAMLEATGEKKLISYIERQPENALPIFLETGIAAPVFLWGRELRLRGRVDRIDQRQDGIVIVDYKSGHVPSSPQSLFRDDFFYSSIENTLKENPKEEKIYEKGGLFEKVDYLFKELRKKTKSIQLATYIAIMSHPNRDQISLFDEKTDTRIDRKLPSDPVYDAVFVELARDGDEISFFKTTKKNDGEAQAQRELAVKRCSLLVRLVLAHMMLTKQLEQCPEHKSEKERETACAYCPFIALCRS